jgi:uncharacterized glyoxalase superfamily protein PhnB
MMTLRKQYSCFKLLSRLPTVLRQDSLLLYIQNAIEFFDKIKDKVKIIKGIEKTFYGATNFGVEDNNGYLLTLPKMKR